jgi:hypothetical protein
MDTIQLLGSTIGLGFVAELRLYSTVLVLGLGFRFGLLRPPAGFEQLSRASNEHEGPTLAELKHGILLNRLILHTATDEVSFYVFKTVGNS